MCYLFKGCFGTTRLYGAGQIVKKDGALFGPPKTEYNLPKTTKPQLSSSGEFKYTGPRKDVVPSKEDKPIMGITTTKNFVTANAVEAILQGTNVLVAFFVCLTSLIFSWFILFCVAPKPAGNKELNYMKKEDFGKVPAYLSQVKEEIRRENEMIERYVKEQMGEVEAAPEVYEEFEERERQELIAQLKAKWDSVNAQYQKITHLVKLDTTGQVRRKEQLEGELARLENDILRLERAGSILIRG
jgi:hypothetical protein